MPEEELNPTVTVVLTEEIMEAIPILEEYGFYINDSVDIVKTQIVNGAPDRPPTPPLNG